MIDVLQHLFVWIASPVILFGLAISAIFSRRYFLGFIGTSLAWIVCGLIAYNMFDEHLLIYNLLYLVFALIPLSVGIITVFSWLAKGWGLMLALKTNGKKL